VHFDRPRRLIIYNLTDYCTFCCNCRFHRTNLSIW